MKKTTRHAEMIHKKCGGRFRIISTGTFLKVRCNVCDSVENLNTYLNPSFMRKANKTDNISDIIVFDV